MSLTKSTTPPSIERVPEPAEQSLVFRRFAVGTVLILCLVALCWGDHLMELWTGIPGVALFPVLTLLVVVAVREIMELAEAGGVKPIRWVVYTGTLLVVTSSWATPLWFRFARGFYERFQTTPSDWTLFAIAAGLTLVLLAEMRRFSRPGGITVNVAAAVFAMIYVGLMLSFLVQIRIIWGLRALLATIFAVKMADTGAYCIGNLFGRSKMAPGLSPKKTVEGAVGAMLSACLASWLILVWLFPPGASQAGHASPTWGWLPFGLLVGLFGIWGDLAESLIKRDVARKDSGRWFPGLGGVLDVIDSTLLAAPIAYACWAFELVT